MINVRCQAGGLFGQSTLALFIECATKRLGISSAIQHTMYDSLTPDYKIVNGVGKPPREKSMITELDAMDPCVEHQRIDLVRRKLAEFSDTHVPTVVRCRAGRKRSFGLTPELTDAGGQ